MGWPDCPVVCFGSGGGAFVPALALGIVGAGLIGVAVDLLAFNPIRRREAGLLGSIITSIGVAIILGTLADQVTDHRTKRFPPGTFSEKVVGVRGTSGWGPYTG